MKRKVLASEAADILGRWGDRALRPLCTPATDEIDAATEEQCDEFLRVVAHAPNEDLTMFPRSVLLAAWRRIMFAGAAATIDPGQLIAEVPSDWPEERVLQTLIGGALAQTRFPPEGRSGSPLESPGGQPPGSGRLH